MGGVGGVGLLVVGLVAIALTVAVERVEEKRSDKIKYYLQLIFALFLSLFTFIFLFGNLTTSIGLAFAFTLVLLPSLLSFQKLGLGINLILLGLLFIWIGLSKTEDLVTVSLFFLILPLLNALLDYISLKISLFMANKILRDVSILKALFHLLIDTLIAIAFLYMLATFLYFAIDFLNGFIDKQIPIHEMLLGETGVQNDPFSLQNGWITFMLMSTLIPTFVHFVIAVGALLIEVIPSQKALNDLNIYERKQEPALLDTASHYFTRIFFAEILLGLAMIGAIISILVYVF